MKQISTSGSAVLVLGGPQQRHVDFRAAGDVDGDAAPALSDVVARVAALSPEHAFVDLAEAAFAGATLPHFLAGLVDLVPQAMSMTVCRPRPMHQWVLEVTGMAQILMISSRPAGPASTPEDGSHGPR